jgi:small subunit ribosomal protein S8
MSDVLADAVNTIKVNEDLGKDSCTVPSTKLIKAVMDVMKKNGYISGYEEAKEGKFNVLRIALSHRINDIGVVKPRYAVRFEEYQKFETRLIPSKDFGILIVSTPSGIMTNKEAKGMKTGGRLIAYVF